MSKNDPYDQALTILRKWYYTEIRVLAKEALKAAKKSDRDEDEFIQDWVAETIDGHEFVIYTGKAQAVLLASDKSGAYFDEFGGEDPMEGGDIAWSKLAYAAMCTDVQEQIQAERS